MHSGQEIRSSSGPIYVQNNCLFLMETISDFVRTLCERIVALVENLFASFLLREERAPEEGDEDSLESGRVDDSEESVETESVSGESNLRDSSRSNSPTLSGGMAPSVSGNIADPAGGDPVPFMAGEEPSDPDVQPAIEGRGEVSVGAAVVAAEGGEESLVSEGNDSRASLGGRASPPAEVAIGAPIVEDVPAPLAPLEAPEVLDPLPPTLIYERARLEGRKRTLLQLPARRIIGIRDGQNEEEFEGMTHMALRRLSNTYAEASTGQRPLTPEEALLVVNSPLKRETINRLSRLSWDLNQVAERYGYGSESLERQAEVLSNFRAYLFELEEGDIVEARKVKSISITQLCGRLGIANHWIGTYREGFGAFIEQALRGEVCMVGVVRPLLTALFRGLHFVRGE